MCRKFDPCRVTKIQWGYAFKRSSFFIKREPPLSENNLNIDTMEIARYAAMADKWWDKAGAFKPLHEINPVRVEYIRNRTRLSGKKLLDVGCGGGLLSEAMAASGARVTGIDMAGPALEAAKVHMKKGDFQIDYRQDTAENFAQTHEGSFDAVICMELVEHVPDPASVIRACARLARPGGHLFFATLNRTWLSLLLVILVSEYVLGVIGKGTHEYRKFIRPQEMRKWGVAAGLDFKGQSGLRYIPLIGYSALCTSTAMNYLMHFSKRV